MKAQFFSLSLDAALLSVSRSSAAQNDLDSSGDTDAAFVCFKNNSTIWPIHTNIFAETN